MVFSSHLFIFYFLPLALLVYYLLPMRGKYISLTLVSYVFYGWANPWFVLIMVFQTLVAGPIVRFQDVADQFVVRTHTLEKFARGVALFSFGLAKKNPVRQFVRENRRNGVQCRGYDDH